MPHIFFSSPFMHTPTPINVPVQYHTSDKEDRSKRTTKIFFPLFPSTHQRTNEKRFVKTRRHTQILFSSSFFVCFVFFFRFSWLFFYGKTIVWESNVMKNILFCLVRLCFCVFIFVCLFSAEFFLRLLFFVRSILCVYISRLHEATAMLFWLVSYDIFCYSWVARLIHFFFEVNGNFFLNFFFIKKYFSKNLRKKIFLWKKLKFFILKKKILRKFFFDFFPKKMN